MAETGSAKILALLMTDLVGSTRLTETLGDERWATVSARCDGCAREAFAKHHGREIDKSDGFLVVFERPIDAVHAALALHRALAELGKELGLTVESRAAIHLGEAILRETPAEAVVRGAKAVEVEGLVKPMAARLMGLAGARQTLMGGAAFEVARRASVGNDSLAASVQWRAHGPYSLKGVEEEVEVFEVGEEGFAPLSAPPDSDKAKNTGSLDYAIVAGWRPSAGADVPSAPGWTCVERLGAGAFGEVWKVMRRNAPGGSETKAGALDALPAGTTLAFKFCFDLVHARALRREATLFKLIQQTFGHHRGVVTLIDFQLERAPLYLAMEYVPGKNVGEWLAEEGKTIPIGRRLQYFAEVASTIAEVHGAGIILADIKPSNILVRYRDGGMREFVLADLGIGRLREKSLALDAAITKTTGFTKTNLTVMAPLHGNSAEDSGGGTLLYLAPEVMEGTLPNPATDMYAFGVTIFQVAACNAKLAVSDDWRRHVERGPARGLIRRMLAGNPNKRPKDFRRVERRLRRMPSRVRIRMALRGLAAAAAWVLFLAVLAWQFVLPGHYKKEEQRFRGLSREKGIPTTRQEFNAKYPATPAGKETIRATFDALCDIREPKSRVAATMQVPLEKLRETRAGALEIKLATYSDFEALGEIPDWDAKYWEKLEAIRASAPQWSELAFPIGEEGAFKRIRMSEENGSAKVIEWRLNETLLDGVFEESLVARVRAGDPEGAYRRLVDWYFALQVVRSAPSNRRWFYYQDRLNGALEELFAYTPPEPDTCRLLLERLDPKPLDWSAERLLYTHSMWDSDEFARAVRKHPLKDLLPPIANGVEAKRWELQLIASEVADSRDPKEIAANAKEASKAIGLVPFAREHFLPNDALFQHELHKRVRITQAQQLAFGVLLRLWLLESEKGDAVFLPPNSLEELHAADGLGIPEDLGQPAGTKLRYEVLPDIGAVRVGWISPSTLRPGACFWYPKHSPTIDAVIVTTDRTLDLRSMGKGRVLWKGDDPTNPNRRLNHIMRMRLDSGKQVSVVCSSEVAASLGITPTWQVTMGGGIIRTMDAWHPEGWQPQYVPDTRVRLRKQPTLLQDDVVLELIASTDIEVIPQPTPKTN